MGAISCPQKSIFPPDSLSDGPKQTCIFSAIVSPPSGQPSFITGPIWMWSGPMRDIFSLWWGLMEGKRAGRSVGTLLALKCKFALGHLIRNQGEKSIFVDTKSHSLVGRFMHVWRDSSEAYKTAHYWVRFRVHKNRYFLLIPYQMAQSKLAF